MTENEYKELISLLRSKLIEAGKAHLADPELYIVYQDDDGPRRRLSDKDTVIFMLKAFERELSLEDRDQVNASLEYIHGMMDEGKGPTDVFVLPTPKEGEELNYETRIEIAQSQGTLTNLRDIDSRNALRSGLRSLIISLAEDEGS